MLETEGEADGEADEGAGSLTSRVGESLCQRALAAFWAMRLLASGERDLARSIPPFEQPRRPRAKA